MTVLELSGIDSTSSANSVMGFIARKALQIGMDLMFMMVLSIFAIFIMQRWGLAWKINKPKLL